ncbi:MAG: hypothetical protein MJZ73_08065 [Bacteroidaceae bacterium]|nr:hypothetical protein [Bacteroidaceae bacterium]
MEKTKEIKGFKEYKTNVRAVADGINLLGRHAGMLLKACGPLLLLVSVLWAWASLSGLIEVNQAVTSKSLDNWSWLSFLPLMLTALAYIVALAQFYSLFQGYVANGFIPQMSIKSIWNPTFKVLTRNTLIVTLWILFVDAVFLALAIYLFSLTPYTLIATVPLGWVLTLWNLNLMADVHVQEGTLVRAITRSLKVTFRGFLSFSLMTVLLFIVASVVGIIVSTPSLVSNVIYAEASFSEAMGDGADLPGYFNNVYFIFSMIVAFLLLIVNFLMLSSWTMLYGAVSHRNSKKYQSLSQKD